MMLLGNFLSFGVVAAVAGSGASGDPYKVAEALLIQDNSIATVQGYIVGQPTSATKVLAGSFTADTAIAIADIAGETDTTKILYVQLPSSPASLRANYGLKTNPGDMGIKVNVTGNLTPYFTPHVGLKNTTSISTVTESDPNDTTPPVITHSPLTIGTVGVDLVVSAQVTDNNQVSQVKLYYRAKGLNTYRVLI